jgi:hypothetical protein
MSFQKWIARRFAVGGTARLFAKQYNWLKQNKYKLDTPDKLIYNDIIMMRFKYPHTRDLMQMVENGTITGLKDLVIEVLTIEAAFKENTFENQIMFSEVIEEELLKKNIPLSVIN